MLFEQNFKRCICSLPGKLGLRPEDACHNIDSKKFPSTSQFFGQRSTSMLLLIKAGIEVNRALSEEDGQVFGFAATVTPPSDVTPPASNVTCHNWVHFKCSGLYNLHIDLILPLAESDICLSLHPFLLRLPIQKALTSQSILTSMFTTLYGIPTYRQTIEETSSLRL